MPTFIPTKDNSHWKVFYKKVSAANAGEPTNANEVLEVFTPNLVKIFLDVVFENIGESAEIDVFGWNAALQRWVLLERVNVNHVPSNQPRRYTVNTQGSTVGITINSLVGTVTIAGALGAKQ
jgi:hypothetical protein